MAGKLSDVIGRMKASISAQGQEPSDSLDQVLSLAANFLVGALGRTGEHSSAAILMTPVEGMLAFVYPHHLATGNMLPVSRDSLAGQVVLAAQPRVFNDVAKQMHQGVFELIPDGEGTVRSIQKMIAAPILGPQGEVIGVVEVNRTGASPSQAGPDFVATDASNLAKCCRAFAPFLHRTWNAVRAAED